MSTPNLRIVFMGTPEFAVTILDKIVSSDWNVVGVVTVPDKPAGRGQKLHQSAVKTFALDKQLLLLQPEKLKSPDFIERLQVLNADVFVVVAFRMLPEIIWKMPPKGTFNLHGSLLPHYRGAAPINWAVINGEKKTGVTTFFLNHDIDTGAIILQKEMSIGENDTAGEVHDHMMHLGALAVIETLDAIAKNQVQAIPQNTNGIELKHAPKIFREDCRIDWSRPLPSIHNSIRGLSPYPAAWTEIEATNGEVKQLKLFKTAVSSFTSEAMDSVKFETRKSELYIHLPQGGVLEVTELQLEGKRKMSVKEFLLGFDFSSWKIRY